MRRLGFWVRWAARDLRARWVQVVVLGLVIAVGSGLYAGLTSTTAWRLDSLDASYSALAAHDVRIELADGTFLPEGEMAAAAGTVTDVAAARERLDVPTRIEADPGGGADEVLVAGRLVGVAAPDGEAIVVDGLSVTDGRSLGTADAGAQRPELPVVVGGDHQQAQGGQA